MCICISYARVVLKYPHQINVTGENFAWVSCLVYFTVPENDGDAFALAVFFFFFFFNFVSVLKQLMQRDVDLGKQYEPVAVVCRVWLRKVLLLVLFARPSWKGLIIETNWGRKRTGSIRASSTASFKLVVGLKR